MCERLAKRLDDLPAGVPRSETGAEMRILRQLFTPEDAELALHLTLIDEEARVIAHRAKISVEEATRRLEEMDRRGLRARGARGSRRYTRPCSSRWASGKAR